MMLRILHNTRFYCKNTLQRELNNNITERAVENINFKQIRYPSKVPTQPIEPEFEEIQPSKIEINTKTIQLLERLALVDLDSKEALKTLKSSIQFANKIANIKTEGIEPLYTTLENENLFLRPDQVTEGNCGSEILQSAKKTDEGYFVSPPGNIPLEQEEKEF